MMQQVPAGFESSHAEWLRMGGQAFRELHRFGPRPDFYRNRYWKLVKEAVLTSRQAKCCRCAQDASQVHHLNYEFVGEDHLHPDTLVAICKSCHGLLEYARKAESLISRISRRMSLCKRFSDGRPCRDQTAAHVGARLLEYQDELAELRSLFATEIHYRNPRIRSEAEREAALAQFRQKRQGYEERGVNLVAKWNGSEKEKAERLLPMLELEIHKCRKFVAEVFQPISRPAGHLPSAGEASISAWSKDGRPSATPESEGKAHQIESLVVGIKYHRGHVDGVAPGDSVRFVREPNNPYDPNAIKVTMHMDETLGYLTTEFAAVLAKQMDAGMCVRAEVSRIVREKVYVVVTVGDA